MDDLTAFKGSLRQLREKLSSATINPDEFRRKLKRCCLFVCAGTCCYDGASIDEETARQIQDLAKDRSRDFTKMGLNLPNNAVAASAWNGVVGAKTAVGPFPFRSRVKDYPAHFNDTACVFFLADGRCGLQRLGEEEGRPPWYYKPFTCWLHPIKLSQSAIRLYDEATDPNKLPDYDGYVIRTHCGRTDTCGRPAAEVLQEELDFLGRLLDRDLVAEIQQAPNASSSSNDSSKAPGTF